MIVRVCPPASTHAGPLACSFVAALVLTAPFSASAAEQCKGEPVRINVVTEGLRSIRGDLVVEIYPDSAKQFLVPGAQVNSIHVKLEGSPATVCLAVPHPGAYAVAVFHDQNSDSKFNRNVLGIPSEGFGLSNNPPIRLSMPPFSSMRFEAGEGETTVHIRMHYLLGGSAPR